MMSLSVQAGDFTARGLVRPLSANDWPVHAAPFLISKMLPGLTQNLASPSMCLHGSLTIINATHIWIAKVHSLCTHTCLASE